MSSQSLKVSKDALKDIYLEVQNRAPRVSKGLFLWSTFILLRARPATILLTYTMNSKLICAVVWQQEPKL